MTHYVLDTHALVWFLANNPRLGKKASELFDDPSARFLVPTLVLCEISHLAHKGRVTKDAPKILKYLKDDARFEMVPLDETVVRNLPHDLDIHDAIIVATALACLETRQIKTALLTRDEKIRESGLVEIIWD